MSVVQRDVIQVDTGDGYTYEAVFIESVFGIPTMQFRVEDAVTVDAEDIPHFIELFNQMQQYVDSKKEN